MVSSTGLLAGLILALALIASTFWPEGVFAPQRDKSRLEFLLERLDQLAENQRDLEFEFRAGKYPPEEFQSQKSQMEQEAATVAAEIEQIQKG